MQIRLAVRRRQNWRVVTHKRSKLSDLIRRSHAKGMYDVPIIKCIAKSRYQQPIELMIQLPRRSDGRPLPTQTSTICRKCQILSLRTEHFPLKIFIYEPSLTCKTGNARFYWPKLARRTRRAFAVVRVRHRHCSTRHPLSPAGMYDASDPSLSHVLVSVGGTKGHPSPQTAADRPDTGRLGGC